MTDQPPPPPPPPASNTKKKRAKKKARDAAAAADTTSYLMVGLRKCGVEEKFLESYIGLIGETKRKKLEGRLKEIEDAEAELSVKRAELIVDQILMIMDYPLSSTDSASDESKPQPEKYLAELLQLDPHFGTYPEHTLKRGLENIPVSMWAEMQVKWRHLQSAEWEHLPKRSKLAAYYLKLLCKAASKW